MLTGCRRDDDGRTVVKAAYYDPRCRGCASLPFHAAHPGRSLSAFVGQISGLSISNRPHADSWYQDAKAVAGQGQENEIIFTAPYKDANTNKLIMTAAAPLFFDTARGALGLLRTWALRLVMGDADTMCCDRAFRWSCGDRLRRK
jgi:hypothetical protein